MEKFDLVCDGYSGEFPLSKVTLRPITYGDIYSNERCMDAIDTFEKTCIELKKGIKSSNPAYGLLFIFRSVASGGVARSLASFKSKPLTYSAKSIAIDLILDKKSIAWNIKKEDIDSIERLSGLLPTNPKLSKPPINPVPTPASKFFYRKISDVDSTKYWLHFIEGIGSNKLVWIKEADEVSSETSRVSFCGDSVHKPIIADWDLVSIAVSNRTFECTLDNLLFTKGTKVVNTDGTTEKQGILPQMLENVIQTKIASPSTANTVVRHGPESMYCRNKVDNDKYFVVTNIAQTDSGLYDKPFIKDNICVYQVDHWYKLEQWIQSPEWFYYKFPQFNGSAIVLSDKQKGEEIVSLNKTLEDLINKEL